MARSMTPFSPSNRSSTYEFGFIVYLRTKGLDATDNWELLGCPFIFRIHGGFGGETRLYWKGLIADFLFIISSTYLAGVYFEKKRSFIRLIILLLIIFFAVRGLYLLIPASYFMLPVGTQFLTAKVNRSKNKALELLGAESTPASRPQLLRSE